MSAFETKDLDVKVAIETTFLGWLCAATNLTPKVAMCHLYDLCTAPLEHLIKRNGTWVSRKVEFPVGNIKLKVHCSNYLDKKLFWDATTKWHADCKAQTGSDTWQSQDPKVRAWLKNNPRPNEWNDKRFHYVKCKFTLLSQDKELVYSQDEMESLVVETLLLGNDDGV